MSIIILYKSNTLNMEQRLLDITEQIRFGFEPGGKAYEAVANPELGSLLGFETRMRRRCRMSDEALRIPKIVRDIDEPQRVEKTEAAFLVPGDLETHQAAASLHLPTGELVLRMTGQAGKKDAGDLRMVFEITSNGCSSAALPVNAELQGFEPLQQ